MGGLCFSEKKVAEVYWEGGRGEVGYKGLGGEEGEEGGNCGMAGEN